MMLIPDGLLETAKLVAAETALPELGDAVVSAIDLAVQLLLHDVDQPMVARVAALDPKATRSDAEPAIREMLEELGLGIPDRLDADGHYELLRHGVGFWDVPIAIFEGPFYERIPAWDDQGTVDRALVQLLDQRDRITTNAGRLAIDARIRAVARYADDAAVLSQIEAVMVDQGRNRPVSIPNGLARAAEHAWLRDEAGTSDDELPEERELRDKAGALALIGLAVNERGEAEDEHILVSLTTDAPPADPMIHHLADLESSWDADAERGYDPVELVRHALLWPTDYWPGLALRWLEQGVPADGLVDELCRFEADAHRDQTQRHRARALRKAAGG